MTLYAVVLAGGSGTRLWPYSRRDHPKQFLPLFGDRSMLALTVDRLAPLVPAERVFVLTNAEYTAAARAAVPRVPPAQVIGEPAALGTAAAVGLGLAVVRARDPGAVMVVVTADHLIAPEDAFRRAVADAARVAAAGWLVTFGVRPTSPETGYGYIELGARLAAPMGGGGDAGIDAAAGSGDFPDAFTVARFVEKPDRAVAEGYLAAGRFVWNSGMFAWAAPVLAGALARHLPDLAARVDEITAAAGAADFDARLGEIWGRVTDRTSVDYGIMEKSDRVACLPAAFEWRDIGAWDALKAALPADADGNAVVGPHVGVDTRGSLVFGRAGRLIATVGVEDLVIVDTGDAVLVCRLDRAQDIKAVVDALKARGEGWL